MSNLLAKDLRIKTIKELEKEFKDKKKELEKFSIDVYKGKEKNITKGKFIKKDMARISTVLSEKLFLEDTDNA